jgi:hypothetical protein
MKIHDRFLFVWVVLVQIIFRNSRKIGSQICLIELVNIWWVVIDQHGAIEYDKFYNIIQFSSENVYILQVIVLNHLLIILTYF